MRAYFADRGRLPTPEEEAVLDECLRADSRFNLLLTRYAGVRIADAEAARELGERYRAEQERSEALYEALEAAEAEAEAAE